MANLFISFPTLNLVLSTSMFDYMKFGRFATTTSSVIRHEGFFSQIFAIIKARFYYNRRAVIEPQVHAEIQNYICEDQEESVDEALECLEDVFITEVEEGVSKPILRFRKVKRRLRSQFLCKIVSSLKERFYSHGFEDVQSNRMVLYKNTVEILKKLNVRTSERAGIASTVVELFFIKTVTEIRCEGIRKSAIKRRQLEAFDSTVVEFNWQRYWGFGIVSQAPVPAQ